jgi:autotransporter-associated beta strand protein
MLAWLAAFSAAATTFYWDNTSPANATGFGTANGTWSQNSTTGGRWTTSSNGSISGSSTQVTSAADTFNLGTAAYGLGAGTITVSGGVTMGNTTFGAASGAIVFTGGTITYSGSPTLTVNNASDTIDSVIAGAGASFTKAGGGTLILSGANTYTGGTIITGGTLELDGTNLSAITVGSGATLAGSGQVNAAVTVNNGGSVTAGDGASGVLTVSSLTYSGTGTNNFGDLSGYTNEAAINVTGNLTLNGGAGAVTLNLPATTVTSGIHHLIQFGSGVANTNGFTLGTTPLLAGQTAGLQVNGSYLDYVVTRVAPPALSSTLPATNGTVLAPVAGLVATFDETVVAGSGSIELRRSSDGSLVEAFDVASSSQLVFSGAQLTIDPTNDLVPGQYYVLIPAGAIQDGSGNTFPGLGVGNWSFTVATVLSDGGAGTIYDNASDCEVQFTLSTPPYAINDLTSSLLFCGSAGSVGKERCPVFPLQLPDLGPVTNPFASAAFSFNLASFVNTPIANADLYGLARRASAVVLTNDYWTATSTVDPSPNATLLETNLMTPASPLGLITTTDNGNINLVDFLNAQYAGGAGAGQFVFLRLSTDRAETGGANRYQITSAEGAGAASNTNLWPQVNYTLNPTGVVLQVESRADGTGGLVPATSLMPGASLTNFAIVRSNGIFLTNTPATWLLTNIAGLVLPTDLTVAPDGHSAVFTANGDGSAQILAVGGGATGVLPSGLITVSAFGSNAVGRPFIWVRSSNRAGILAKIATNAWALSLSNSLAAREASDLASYLANRDSYLRQLPVTWTASPATFNTQSSGGGGPAQTAETMFNNALDCAVLYYLSADTNYARCAADVLYNSVQTLIQVAPSTSVGDGGWIIQGDLLYEARQVGTQLAMIYDFVYPYLLNHQVYDVQTPGMVNFNYDNAQNVFRTYYNLCTTHGDTGDNWSSLMASCMLANLLALDSPSERAADLQVYLTTGGSREDSLDHDYNLFYTNSGSIWHESFQYSGSVGTIRTYHMVLLERYDPTLTLFADYPNLPTSLPRIAQFTYPDPSQQIIFGDGHRTDGASQPFSTYEMVYQQALARGYTNLTSLFGGLINGGISAGQYSRSTLSDYSKLGPHNEPLQLLWDAPTITNAPTPLTFPRTDALPWAGIALQRNPSTVNNSTYGLQCFVGGAAHVHSHASGMNMELYGLGQVLGSKSGVGSYGTALHENYYRLFAGANTVIVNGASEGSGGWESVAINTVQTVAMEPQPFADAVSSNFSFTCSSFDDTKGTLAEGTEQRTLAIVRTSPTNGFYVDFFRSKSTVATQVATTLNGNVTNQFHDYIYHNVGSDNYFTVTTNGVPLSLYSQPNRFQNDIGDAYQQPGWRYFTNTMVSYPEGVATRIQFGAKPSSTVLYMDMIMAAVANREYAKVDAPPFTEYDPNPTGPGPTMVVRQIGDAWDKPFAVVYEPHYSAGGATVTNVTALWTGNVVVGLKIESVVGGVGRVHYVLSNTNATDTYQDPALGLVFTGRFGIVSDDGLGHVSLYLGQGKSLSYRGNAVTVAGGTNSAAEVQFTAGQPPVITANSPVNVVPVAAPAFTQVSGPVNGVISFTAGSSPGVPYTLWSCTNLASAHWVSLFSGTVTNSSFVLQDTNATGAPQRYYRFSTP